jgi:type II secretion system protein N
MGFARRAATFFGYLVYGLCLAALLTWYFFPVDAARKRLEFELGKLTPGLEWQVGTLAPALPAGIRAGEIAVRARGRKPVLFALDSVYLQPNLAALARDRKKLQGSYRLELLQGTVKGRALVDTATGAIRFQGRIDSVDLGAGKGLQGLLRRSAAGKLSASFKGSWHESRNAGLEMKGELQVEQGRLGFQQPVLGMKQLDFSRLHCRFAWDAKGISLNDGTVEATLLKVLFSGTIQPRTPVERSALALKGTMIPRPEFLGKVGDPAMITLLKRELQDGRLPFTVNGTLKEPAIFFPGLSGGLEKYLHGGGKS